MPTIVITVFCLLAVPLLALSQTVIPLGSQSWTVSSPSLNITVLGSFPSQAHLDLYDAEVIGDPYHNLNDFNLRWVARSNWTYSASLAGLSQKAASTWLLFDGLDTFTSISLCGQHLAATNNQFLQYYFNITNLLEGCRQGEPQLSIEFGSAPNIVNAIANQPNQETWPSDVEQVFEFPNRQFMRKEQSDFGWDWGPAFAPAGPWLPGYTIELDSNQLYPRNFLIDIYRQGQLNNRIPDQSQPWVVNCSIDFLGTTPIGGATLRFNLTNTSGESIANGSLEHVSQDNGVITGSTILPADAADLWWPNGLGPQNLYNMTVFIVGSSNATLASVQRRVGFRTIVLNQEPVSGEQIAMGIAPGNNWHFEINGHVFFAKGSNFVPPDAFWPRVTEGQIRKLFESVIASNQNMLRVWSSGAYGPDFLYEVADELGILLWSEFEFGDALYPVDQEFLNNVYEEVVYQVRRLNYHPSLAFWAGGNELENLELLLVNGTTAGREEYSRYKSEYELLFLTTIFPAVFENTHSISYAPSSTSNGFITLNFTQAPYFQERYENLTAGSVYGETDYYNYNATVAFDSSSYPVGRFSNEFGFHSMPSLQTWQQAISPQYLSFNSSVIQLRNHHYPPGGLNTSNFAVSEKGMGEMTLAAAEWYPTPHKTNPVANFSAWCHTTQLFQADYYESQIAFYRRGAGLRQHTLGSLYWQLNDIWQAPSWAGIEYDGRWKAMQYQTKRAYESIIVYPFYNASTSEIQVWAMSDLWDTVNGTLDLTWFDWSGRELAIPKGASKMPFTVNAINASSVFSGNVGTILAPGGYDPRDVVMMLNFTTSGHKPNNATLTIAKGQAFMAPTSLAEARLVDPGLTITFENMTKSFTVTATKGIAKAVWLDYPAGAVVRLSDNAFWLQKGASRVINYEVLSDTTAGKWVEGVTVESLWNNTLSQ